MALQFIVNDFQSIESVKILVDGVTLIQGDSNAGKSATLRALEAACTNRFRQGQVRNGADHATIKIKTPESNNVLTVVRPWSGSIKMKLGDEVFTKIGRTTPSQVTSFLNLGIVDLMGDSYSLNFHPQFQKPLLLEYSQQKVMEILSASTALDDLKETKEALLLKRQQNKGAISLVQNILDENTQSLHTLQDEYDSMTPKITHLTQLSTKLDNFESDLDILVSLESISLPDTSKLESLVEQYSLMVTIQESLLTLTSLESISLPDTSSLECAIDKYSKIIPLQESLLKDSLSETDLCNLENSYNSLQEVEEIISQRMHLPLTYPDLTPLDSLETALNLLDSYLTKISQLTNIVENNLCPICGKPLSQHDRL